MKKITKGKKKKGFTLIELIAVIAILAILAAIAIPNVIKYIDNAKSTALQTEASTIYTTAAAKYTDGELKLTGTETFDSVKVSQVTAIADAFVNNPPATKTATIGGTSYTINDSTTMATLKTIMNAKNS